MGIEAGTSLADFIGEAVEVSKSGMLADSVLNNMGAQESHMTPGQDIGLALGAVAFIGFMRADSSLAATVAKLPMDVDMSRVDQALVGTAIREQQEADAANAVIKGKPTDPNMRDEVTHAGIEQREANIATEAVRKAAAGAAKPIKNKM